MSDAAPVGSRKRILIVEDDAGVADMLASLLELEGYEACRADSGPVAINMILAAGSSPANRRDPAYSCAPPDLILLDLQLPAMDGTQMIRHLARLGCPLPPVMILSATRCEAIQAAAESIGAAAAMSKPFMVDELLDQIRSILATPRTA
jgi:DNA-binding response OmpR family regulator